MGGLSKFPRPNFFGTVELVACGGTVLMLVFIGNHCCLIIRIRKMFFGGVRKKLVTKHNGNVFVSL